ncbi:MAG: Calx-beta domain-containing protein, partial [Verrucomicrobiota bacterium]
MLKVVAVFVLSALSGSYTFAQSLNTWWEAPTPDWPALHTVAFGNGTFLAAGKGDRYGRSLDGSAWVVKTFPSGVTAINDLHFANGIFMAVGDQGWILKSTDGVEWSVASANTQASLRAITFGNGRWAILGRASLAGQSIVLSSTDNGSTWTPHLNAGFDVTGLGFGNGYFVACALAGLTTDLRRSADLNQWSSGLNFDWGSTLRQVSYTPTLGRFVAVGDNGRILISQNGSSWSSAISSVNKHLLGIHWGNGECVAVGEQERIISSVDGQNWQVRRAPSESTRHLQDVVFGNGTWVAVGYDQADFWSERTGAIIYSDGLAAGRLSFASATVSVPNASGLVEVEVKRTAGATGPLSVKYQTSDGTAVAGADYEASSGTLFWQDGDVLPQLIRVRILPANGSESAETFSISLSEPSNGGALGSPALVVVTIAAAQQGTAEWANRYPALQGERPNAMARGTNRLVAVGDNGTVATSNDGLSWIDRNSGTTQHLNGIAFGNGRFVAAGQGGVILWSHDGVEWMSSDSALSQDLNEIAFANGKFVVVGAGGLIASSADGAQWNAMAPRTTADLKGASFGGGRWLVTGTEGAVLISMDNAQSWELRPAPTIAGIDLGRNAFGNGTFAVLTSRGFHLTTSDGVNWKPRLADVRLNTELSAVLNSISFIGEKFAIASSEGVIYTSSDAITWERQNSALEQPTCVATGFGSHVALAPGGGASFSQMKPEWHQAQAEEAFAFRAVAFGNGRFVAVADAGRIYVSENGVFWREHTVLETPALRTVVFGADQFVAAGDEGAIFTSPDGLEWTAQVSGTANTVHQVIFTGTHFYAATTTKGQVTSAVLRSRDAVAWEPTYTPGALTTLLGIAYGNGRYVVVGPANFSETSTDGVNFTSLSAPFSTIAFVGVTHGNGLFARARHQIQFTTVTEASIEISTDGRTWQKTWASAGEELNALTYIDGQFIALGKNGLFLVSNDGQNWIRHELGLPRSLHGVTQGPAGDWIVVGDRASIRQRFFSPFPVALKSELKLPISGASQYTDRILQLEATAAALGSEITQVEFYADDEIIGDRLTPPWRLEWRPLEPGQYRLTAVAYGKPGEVRQSPGVPVSIALLPEPPAILVQPKPATIAELTQHTLSIEASGGTPRSYQWFLNGNPIPHATEPSYTIANARAVSSGAYACEVSNAAGTIRSVEAIVTVTPHEGVPAPLWEVREYTPAFHDLNDVVWTGERFVAVGNRGAFAFSENGEEWRGLVYGGAFDNWTGLAAGLDRVIAGGDAGHMLVSDEGTNWVQMFSGIQAPITGVAFGNGRFLAVGQGNTIAMSMDGRTWTRSSYNRSVEFQGVIWFEGLFYAVGDNGALLSSPDGAIWTPRFTGTDRTFRAVAAGNGMLVAVGSEGRIFISHDGEIWENRTFSELATFRMAMFMEGLFVIGDNFGRIYASADGSNWQEQTSSTVGIHAGAYSPALGRGVYVGKAGMV